MTIQQNYGNIKPSLNLDFANTKQLDPRITFARASTATYYDGVTSAKAEENLSRYSSQLNSWGTVGLISKVSTTETDPAGGSTAALVNFTGGGFLFFADFFPQGTMTVSVYAKQGTTNTLRFRIYNNASTSTFTSTTFTLTSSWERYDFTFTNNASASCNFQLDVGGVNTGTVYYAFPQAEARSTVTAYTPTTTQPITNYIPVLMTAAAGVPRFDHNPITGESLGLLIEEQRTNLLTYSEQFDNAAWSKARASISANATAAPDGTTTADKLVEDTSASNTHQAFRSTSVSAGTPHTFSVYVKADGRNFVGVRYENSGSTEFYQVNVNLTNGTATTASFGSPTGTSFSVTSAGNAWWRVSITTTTSNTGFQSVVYLQSVQGSNNYTGDGVSGIYIWGAQLEAGAFATSYIPTVASQVTRAADAASMTGTNFSSWYNQGEGTLYAEIAQPIANTQMVPLGLLGDSTDQISVYFPASSSLGLYVFNAGATQANIASAGNSVLPNVFGKAAGTYRANDFALSVNGSAASTDASGTIPSVNRMTLRSSGSQRLRKVSYYPLRVTNAQLQALTT